MLRRSDAGVVNLYSLADAMASPTPAPQRALLNLTTSISTLRFNSDGQILAFGSRFKRDSLRLVRGRWMAGGVTSGAALTTWLRIAFCPLLSLTRRTSRRGRSLATGQRARRRCTT